MNFTVSADQKQKQKENKKKDKYLDLAREIKKTTEHECDGDASWNWNARYIHQSIDKGTGGLGNERTSGDHSDYSIVEIGQNTKKIPGDLRFAVT